jgi:NAD(P)-dependent dehydrogenase (short-subunit alcohol dehydrogenase family)
MVDLGNKVVVITGGAGLIGSSFVEHVARCGGIPIIAEINDSCAKEVQARLSKKLSTDKIYSFKCDITDEESISIMLNALIDKFGTVDVLVNNAYPRNKNFGRHFFDVEYKDFAENIGLNVGGYFLAAKVFSKYFLEQGHGNIINIASIYGVVPPRFEIYEGTKMSNSVEYSAIKAGVIHLTKYIAKYVKGNNIRVNSLSLGGILDNQPQSFLDNYKKYCLNKGMLLPDDVAGTLIFLISDASEFVNGQNIIVDDGFTL